MIGNAIWRTGIYDLAVTEAVYRLLPVGGTGVDAGANIGYITSLMQVRAGLTGRVYAFEPHPEIVKRLNVNVQEGPGCASVHAIGLSDRDGTAHLILQDAETGVPFNLNNGVAHIGEGSDSSKCSIRVSRLDNIIENERVNVLKIDVEGHEYKVLKGAIKLIKNKNISSIIFEDHEGFDSDVCKLLKSFGYTVWRLSLTHRRLRLLTPDDPVPPAYAPPNFVAGLDAEHTYETLRSPGWQSI
jgi:FkbM family methyltransferase